MMIATLWSVAVKSVLIVEDDKSILQGLQELLEDEGYTVYTANNGLEALRVLRTTPNLPTVIILDLMMPVMDGYQFRKEQDNDPKLSSIPVILMTAGNGDIASKKRQIGAKDFIKKPLNIEDLLKKVASFFP